MSLLEDTIERFVDVMAYLRSPVGLHRYNDHIFIPTPANIRKIFKDFDSVEASLQRLEEGALSWYDRLKVEEMRRMMQSTRIELEWEAADPIYPIEALAGAIQDLLDYPFMREHEKMRLIVSKLRHSQFLFQACMMLNQRLSKLHIRLATELGRAVMEFLKEVPSSFKMSGDDGVLAEAANDAASALSQYVKYLESKASGAPDQIVPQRHQYERMLQGLWCLDVSVEDLRRIGEEQLELWSKKLLEYARQIEPDAKDWRAAWEKIKTYDPATEEEIVDDHRRLLEEVRQALKEADVVDLPAGESVETLATPQWRRMFATGASCSSDDMYGGRVTSKLHVTPRTAGVRGPMPPPSRVLLAHECYAGHHVHAINIGQYAPMPFKIRTQIRVPVSEGWAMLAEEFLKDKFTPVEMMQLCMSVIRRAVRIIVDVGLNTGEMTYDQAVDFYEKTIGVRATNEVNGTLVMPGYKSTYLFGKVALEQLRDEIKEELGHRFDIKWFNNLLVRAGTMSLSGIRAYIRHHAQIRKGSP
jgi:uncharacterized protein (DUF885 family)